MIAIDTNVLIRVLVDDSTAPQQCDAARKAVAAAGKVRVAGIVFIETLWVLHKSYRVSRKDVSRIAGELLGHPRYQVEDAAHFRSALDIFGGSNIDFADAIALLDAQKAQCVLHTFDRKLAKQGAKLVA